VRERPEFIFLPQQREQSSNMEETSADKQAEDAAQPPVESSRSNNAGPVWQLRTQPSHALSPISEIASTLEGTKIATPTTSKEKVSRIGE
jgi:hypothetical protein